MRHKILILLLTLAAPFAAESQSITTDSVEKMAADTLLLGKDGSGKPKVYDHDRLFYDESRKTYTLLSTSPVLNVSHNLGGTTLKVSRPEGVSIFGDRRKISGGFAEDTDPNHNIKDGETSYIYLGDVNKVENDSVKFTITSGGNALFDLVVKYAVPAASATASSAVPAEIAKCQCGCSCPIDPDTNICPQECDCECHKQDDGALPWGTICLSALIGLIIGAIAMVAIWHFLFKNDKPRINPLKPNNNPDAPMTPKNSGNGPDENEEKKDKDNKDEKQEEPAKDSTKNLGKASETKASETLLCGVKTDDLAKWLVAILQLNNKTKIAGLEDLQYRIKQLGFRKIFDEWNQTYPDNTADITSLNPKTLMETVKKGYMGPDFAENFSTLCAEQEVTGLNDVDRLQALMAKMSVAQAVETPQIATDNSTLIKNLEATIGDLTRDKEDLIKQIKALRAQNSREATAAEADATSLSDDNEEIQRLNQEISIQKERITTLERQINNLTRELEREQSLLDTESAKNEEFSRKISQLHFQITDQEDKDEKKISAINKDHEEKIAKIQADSQRQINMAKSEAKSIYEDEISSLKNQLSQLQNTIADLQSQIAAPRSQLADQVTRNMDKIAALVAQLKDSTSATGMSTPAIGLVDIVADGFGTARRQTQAIIDNVDRYPSRALLAHALSNVALDDWMGLSGWVNVAALLSAYAHIPSVGEVLNAQGVVTRKLSLLFGAVSSLYGALGITLVVPNLLSDTFDLDDFDAQNREPRINQINSDILSRDFVGKAFDMIQVGYITESESVKPRIKHF